MLSPNVLEQTELRRDDLGQVGFDVPDRIAAGEIESAEGVPARELQDLRRAGLVNQLRDALVPGLEHRSVEGELVALQPVLAQYLIVRRFGADQLGNLPSEGDVRELAVVGGDLGRHADERGVSRHGVSIADRAWSAVSRRARCLSGPAPARGGLGHNRRVPREVRASRPFLRSRISSRRRAHAIDERSLPGHDGPGGVRAGGRRVRPRPKSEAGGTTAVVRGALTSTFPLPVPVGLNPGDIVLGANRSVSVNDRASVFGTTPLGAFPSGGIAAFGSASDLLNIGKSASAGRIWATTPLLLRNNAEIIFYKTSGAVQQQTGVVFGDPTENRSNATIRKDPIWTVAISVPTSGAAINVFGGQTRTLDLGSYGPTTVFSGGTLRLTGGTYGFVSLDLEPGAIVQLDDPGQTTVGVNTSVILRARLGGAGFVFGYLGTQTAHVEAPFTGDLFLAPAADIEIKSDSTGHFFGNHVTVFEQVRVSGGPAGSARADPRATDRVALLGRGHRAPLSGSRGRRESRPRLPGSAPGGGRHLPSRHHDRSLRVRRHARDPVQLCPDRRPRARGRHLPLRHPAASRGERFRRPPLARLRRDLDRDRGGPVRDGDHRPRARHRSPGDLLRSVRRQAVHIVDDRGGPGRRHQFPAGRPDDASVRAHQRQSAPFPRPQGPGVRRLSHGGQHRPGPDSAVAERHWTVRAVRDLPM